MIKLLKSVLAYQVSNGTVKGALNVKMVKYGMLQLSVVHAQLVQFQLDMAQIAVADYNKPVQVVNNGYKIHGVVSVLTNLFGMEHSVFYILALLDKSGMKLRKNVYAQVEKYLLTTLVFHSK